jgi:hypothetical protein
MKKPRLDRSISKLALIICTMVFFNYICKNVQADTVSYHDVIEAVKKMMLKK